MTLKEDLLAATSNQAFPYHMHKHVIFNVMGNTSRFKGAMVGSMETKAFAKGDVIHTSLRTLNPIGNSVAYVAQGSLDWRTTTHCAVLKEGSSFGEIRACHEGTAPDGGLIVTARTNCILYIIPTKDINSILRDWPSIGKPYIEFLKRRQDANEPDYLIHEDPRL
mmetsp:Transcript_7896/g.15491  ORF Transcript_7896/g.15491 Transcript_7896/m.15491 type:complete len:165 (-) Transcript_7896:1703-2197(-)